MRNFTVVYTPNGSSIWYDTYDKDAPKLEPGDKYTFRVYEGVNGTRIWFNSSGIMHSFRDNPSVVKKDGTLMWHKDSLKHREDGPAVINAAGDQFWYTNGKCQSVDGEPSAIFANGDKMWHEKDILHRENKPAVEFANGDLFWYRNGKLHRMDGPAVVFADGLKVWYKDGHQYGVSDSGDKKTDAKAPEVFVPAPLTSIRYAIKYTNVAADTVAWLVSPNLDSFDFKHARLFSSKAACKEVIDTRNAATPELMSFSEIVEVSCTANIGK